MAAVMLFQQGDGQRLIEHANARIEQAVALAVIGINGCLKTQLHRNVWQLTAIADHHQILRTAQRQDARHDVLL